MLTHRLPLLAKELVEIAARPRTYGMRIAAALLLYVGAALAFADELLVVQADDPSQIGGGRDLEAFVVWVLFAAVHLALPAVLAGSVSGELQRGTLSLLRLSGMGPLTILLQKLGSALAHLMTWLLVAAPLLAVAFSRGGVEAGRVPAAIVALGASALQVGSLALWTSARVPDPGRALLQCYVRMLVWFIGLLPVFSIPLMILAGVISAGVGNADRDAAMAIGTGFFPPLAWLQTRDASPWWTVAACAPSLLSSAIFLWLARRGVELAVTRPPERDPDLVLRRAARGAEAGRRHQKAQREVQVDSWLRQPIAWMERGRVLATFGSLNLSVVLTIGVFALVLVTFDGGLYRGENRMATIVQVVMQLAMAMGVVLVAVGAITADKSAGVHEVLMVTPLSGRDLMVQKLAGARRLSLWMLAPIAYAVGLEMLREDLGARRIVILVAVPAAAWLMAGIIAWLGAWAACAVGRRDRAVAAVLGIIGAWCALPVWLAVLGGHQGDLLHDLVASLSPAELLARLEWSARLEAEHLAAWYGQVFGQLGMLLAVWLGLRFWVLHRADRLLGRV